MLNIGYPIISIPFFSITPVSLRQDANAQSRKIRQTAITAHICRKRSWAIQMAQFSRIIQVGRSTATKSWNQHWQTHLASGKILRWFLRSSPSKKVSHRAGYGHWRTVYTHEPTLGTWLCISPHHPWRRVYVAFWPWESFQNLRAICLEQSFPLSLSYASQVGMDTLWNRNLDYQTTTPMN